MKEPETIIKRFVEQNILLLKKKQKTQKTHFRHGFFYIGFFAGFLVLVFLCQPCQWIALVFQFFPISAAVNLLGVILNKLEAKLREQKHL